RFCPYRRPAPPVDLHSLPTRRAPDLVAAAARRDEATFLDSVADDAGHELARADRVVVAGDDVLDDVGVAVGVDDRDDRNAQLVGDRKSTRRNSSHVKISYAVFWLKKKRSSESRRSASSWQPTTPTTNATKPWSTAWRAWGGGSGSRARPCTDTILEPEETLCTVCS